ncbi:MAG: class I SAM-dependent methyltransferase [Ignavibacteriae bacterium]|nr:MAG: class I SAM-dependent methyltransferase [Ignavibacteriota bacterium]
MEELQNNHPWYSEEAGLFSEAYLKIFQGKLKAKSTEIESDFVQKTLGLEVDSKILDLACGHGRITIELAKRGFNMTGLDLTKYFLNIAQTDAEIEGLNISWVNSDMRKIPFENEFDAVINMFSAFGYLENDEEDEKVIKEVYKSLKPKGKFLIETNNSLRIIKNYSFESKQDIEGGYVVTKRTFDYLRNRHREDYKIYMNDELFREYSIEFRFYMITELKSMLERNGFNVIKVYGNFDFQELTFDSPRNIILAEKV